MNWKRFWHISGEVLFWCLVVAFFVWVALLRQERESERTANNLRVVVRDLQERNFVSPEDIHRLIQEELGEIEGRSVGELNMQEINEIVESHNFVSRAMTFVDYDNVVSVELYQRRPVVRVKDDNGSDYYLSEDLHILPIHSSTHINLPIITGSLPLPVDKEFRGDLAAPLRQLEEEIAKAEAEDKARIEARNRKQEQLREVRRKELKRNCKGASPETQKQLRAENRQINQLEKENNLLEDARHREPIDQMILAKKKYEENYNFLLKLINFVGLTERSPQWSGEFVQFVAHKSTQRVDRHIFTEPYFDLIPRRGEYTIEFGKIDDAEQKLQKLATFLSAGVVNTKGGTLSVEFEGQVVWKAPKSQGKNKK